MVSRENPPTLRSGFLASAERFPDRPAIQVAGESLSYRQLRDRAAAIAATLSREAPDAGPPLTAVFGERSATAFAGVLGALLRGHGYVPLNPDFPKARTRAMLERAGCRSLVVDAHTLAGIHEVVSSIEQPLLIVAPDTDDLSEVAASLPRHRLLGASDLAAPADWTPSPVDPNGLAYLLFTSGSTGQPKGVMVAHRNVTHFVESMVERYGIDENDRFSQTFDLTFDLSVFDMFVAWERGACLCCPTKAQKLLPAKYVRQSELTVWFSVPSTGVMMSRLRLLKPNAFPSLRWSLFCGEALPVEMVRKWCEAAPQSTVENLYGPTELTIACTLYRWNPETSEAESELGVVPIGEPYPGMEVRVAGESLEEVAEGETGELLMTGPQLSLGYWKDDERTAAAFVTPPGETRTFYRTGDRVRRPLPGAPLVYLGRMDNQIKIQGYRVELGEVEAVLREEAGVETAIAVGWPVTSSGADGVVGFIDAGGEAGQVVRDRARARLPSYMQPSEVRVVERWPLNPNGKVDRKALLAGLQGEG